MFDADIAWLDRVGLLVFWTFAIALVTLDAAAVAAVIGTKSRELVNRWTGTVLAAIGVLLTLLEQKKSWRDDRAGRTGMPLRKHADIFVTVLGLKSRRE